MKSLRFVLVGILSVAAAPANAQSFEQQLFQFSQTASAMARQSRQTFLNTQAPAAQAQGAWHKIDGVDGAFTINMPAAPQYSTRAGRVVDIGLAEYAATLHFYAAGHLGRLFAVETVIYPPELQHWSAHTKILERMAMIEKNLDGKKWSTINWKQHQGRTAIDAVALAGGAEVRVLITAQGHQVFTAFYNGPIGTARSLEVNYYIGSLNIR